MLGFCDKYFWRFRRLPGLCTRGLGLRVTYWAWGRDVRQRIRRGFRYQGLGVWGFGRRVEDSGFGVWRLGFKGWSLAAQAQGIGFLGWRNFSVRFRGLASPSQRPQFCFQDGVWGLGL